MSVLAKELHQTQSEVKILREMIDVAEIALGVNIRKKFGAKRS